MGILCVGRTAFSQPAFEVATVKLVDTRNGVTDAGVSVYPGGRLVIHALPLKALIVAAYDVGYWQVSGGEDWIAKDIYDVQGQTFGAVGYLQLAAYQVRDRR